MQHERASQASPAIGGQRDDVLDLADAVLGVERGVPDQLAVRFRGEEAGRNRLANAAARLEDLRDEPLVLTVRLDPDRLGPERAECCLVDLADIGAGGPVGPRLDIEYARRISGLCGLQITRSYASFYGRARGAGQAPG